MKRILIIGAAFALAAATMMAQAQQQAQKPAQGQAAQPQGQAPQPAQPAAKKQPQAKTKEEWEAVQKLGDQSLTPDQRVQLAEEFLKKFPDTELGAFVYRLLMQSYQMKNDYMKMLENGEKVLELEPNDAITLIVLAGAIPERTRDTDLDKEQKLGQAEDYAKRALAAIEKLEKPNPQIPDADWEKIRNDARAQSHAALGLVAIQRKQYAAAEEAFKKAVELQSQKDPVIFWRMGLAYRFNKKYEEAREAYKQAVAAGGVKMGNRDLAAEELQLVDDFLKKRQAAPGGATTPPGAGASGTPGASAGAPGSRPQ